MGRHTEEELKKIVGRTRDALLRATAYDAAAGPGTAELSLSARFDGCCGLAQCIGGYALQDAGFTVRPVATQSLKDHWHPHAALTVQVDAAAGHRWFLVDPTFCQFTAAASAYPVPQPVFHMQQSDEGAAMMRALLEDGYAQITAERAAIYLASLCKGTAIDPETAFAFLTNPPPHPFHFRRAAGSDAFSRENLAKRGLLLS